MKTHENAKFQDITLLGESFIIIPRKIAIMLYDPDEETQQIAHVLLALLVHAYYADGYKHWQGKRYKCNRGEYIGSLRELERLTGFTRRIVSKVLDTLTEQQIITHTVIGRGSRIRLTGYLEFLRQLKTLAIKEKPAPVSPLDDLPTPEQLALTEAAYNMFNF